MHAMQQAGRADPMQHSMFAAGPSKASPTASAPAGASSRPSWRRLQLGQERPCVRCSGLGDSFRDFMKSIEFENWAPRSSRTWRLGQQPTRPAGENELKDADIELLNQRLAGARRSAGSIDLDDDDDDDEAASSSAAASATGQQVQRGRRQPGGEGGAAAKGKEELPQREELFTRSTDDDLADSLNRRIVQVAGSMSMDEGDADSEDGEEAEEDLLTGARLRELVVAKYGKEHDFAFVRTNLPLGKTLVCLNIMFPHLGQKSFPLSEPEYQDKLDGISMYLRAWSQDDKVMAFMKEPAKPRKGLPARPIVGTAVSIQLDLDQATIDEWFPQRYR